MECNYSQLGVRGGLAAVLAWSLAVTGLAQLPPPPVPDAGAALPAPVPESEPADEDLVQLQENGPVHEAFAELVTLDERAGLIVTKAPPAAIEEIPPEVKPEGTNVQWFPGYWAWSDEVDDFVWVSGVWRDIPPGQKFIPGYWNQIDEGYQWVSGFWTNETEEELAYLPEPPAMLTVDASSPQPGPDYFWVPGCWQYRNTSYVWQPGYWNRCYNNWVWVPNRYRWTPRGWLYVRGYWDYPLARRGLLFSPVRFNRPIALVRGYRYSPRRWVNTSLLLTRLFLAPRRGHYYYGNYSGSRYAALGYRPWINMSIGRGGYDPIFAHSSWYYGRSNSNWLASQRQEYSRLASFSSRDFSRGLFHDVRDHHGGPSFTRLTSSQRQSALGSRSQLLSDLRSQRSLAERGGPVSHRPGPGVSISNGRDHRIAPGHGGGSADSSRFRLPQSARDLVSRGPAPGSRLGNVVSGRDGSSRDGIGRDGNSRDGSDRSHDHGLASRSGNSSIGDRVILNRPGTPPGRDGNDSQRGSVASSVTQRLQDLRSQAGSQPRAGSDRGPGNNGRSTPVVGNGPANNRGDDGLGRGGSASPLSSSQGRSATSPPGNRSTVNTPTSRVPLVLRGPSSTPDS
ncbi:MAG: YXWGXW repeat-containing protein, partial [Planctomycetaceae bacterium]|nr:YXWGXW repeat-containing protein [Planctomycetaceae bacterium]